MQKQCEKCGNEYEATGGAQKYCPECKGKPLDLESRIETLERFIQDTYPVDFARWQQGQPLPRRKGSLKGN
jgi:hypothetical protein